MLLRQHAWAIRHRCFISAAQSCVAFSFQSTPPSNEKKCTSSVAEGCIPSATPACTLLPLLLPAYRSFASQAEASQQAVQGAALAPITNGAAVSTIPEQYTRLERITGRYRVPTQAAFAVVEVGPTQFKVCQGDTIVTEKLIGLDVNDTVSLNRILMLGTLSQTIIGRPFVPDVSVTAAVEEQFRDGKVIIFKKKRRKNSRRQTGHRQALTTLRILSITGNQGSNICSNNEAVFADA